MSKVCLACGLAMPTPQKPAEEKEDCPNCGGNHTVVGKKTEEAENAKQEGE